MSFLGEFRLQSTTLTHPLVVFPFLFSIKYLKSFGATVLPAFFGEPEAPSTPPRSEETETDAWRERNEAEKVVEGWMKEYPSGFIVITGPGGSGKTALAQKVVDNEHK